MSAYDRDYYRRNRDARRADQLDRNRKGGWKRRQNYRRSRTSAGRYRHLLRRSRNRGWTDILSFSEWIALVEGASCHYCDGPLPETGSALDRLDGRIGYVVHNVVPCCTLCNTARGELISPDELRLIMAHRAAQGAPGWPNGLRPLQHRANEARQRGLIEHLEERQLDLWATPDEQVGGGLASIQGRASASSPLTGLAHPETPQRAAVSSCSLVPVERHFSAPTERVRAPSQYHRRT